MTEATNSYERMIDGLADAVMKKVEHGMDLQDAIHLICTARNMSAAVAADVSCECHSRRGF